MLTDLKNTFLSKNLVSVHVVRHILFAVTIFPSLVFFSNIRLSCLHATSCLLGVAHQVSGPQSSSGFPGVHLPRMKKEWFQFRYLNQFNKRPWKQPPWLSLNYTSHKESVNLMHVEPDVRSADSFLCQKSESGVLVGRFRSESPGFRCLSAIYLRDLGEVL